MASARTWYRAGEPPAIVWCRHSDCFKTYYLLASAIPFSCPGCSREGKDGVDWWTTERPKGKPVKGVISSNDRRFLRSLKIEPWEGGIET